MVKWKEYLCICAALLAAACQNPANEDPGSAVFVPDSLQKHRITVRTMTNGSFGVIPQGAQYETYPVTLIARPDPGSKYRPGSLRVRGSSGKAIKTQANSGTEWTFEMPAEAVEVDAGFIDEDTELFDVEITGTSNGTIECGQINAAAGDTVTLFLRPDDDCRYRDGSLTISPDAGDLVKLDEDTDGIIWSFTMPESSVTITAEFEEIPSYEIIVADIEHGSITSEPGETARAGAEVTITLTIDDPDNYRYVTGSISITTDSGDALYPETADKLTWTFTMPEEAVTVSAGIDCIPYFSIITNNTGNGRLIIDGIGTGEYAGKARAGYPITVTAIPDPGYKPDGQAVSTFDMPEHDLEIIVDFIELGPLEIYKGGARKGITAGELSDDKKYYGGSIAMESEEAGHNGNQRAIKITHALNAGGNTVQQSFGLFSDTEIELETASALSFWAKANKELKIRYVGFGDPDPDKRVIYTGENFNQSIPITTEWKRYIVPLPAPMHGQKTTRVFLFNAQLAKGNYVYLDDIEFVESGVSLTEINIPDTYDFLLYGATDAEKILAGLPSKLVYTCNDGTVAILQGGSNSHTLKYNLNHWLTPFVEVTGNVSLKNGILEPKDKGTTNTFSLSVNIAGTRSNPMTANIADGITLDDFEDSNKSNIPANPVAATGYIWYNDAKGSVLTRDYVTDTNNEIYSGLAAGNWRPAADAKNPRGGRNFEAKDATGYNTLAFRIRVTAGTSAGSNYQKNTVFTFELKNGGTLTNKANGNFFARQFTYNTDGWQEVKIKLSDFAYTGTIKDQAPILDISAITGYAFSVADNQGAALRIAIDDIVIVNE